MTSALDLIYLSGLLLKNYAIFQSFFCAANFVLLAAKDVIVSIYIFERSTKFVCTHRSIKRIQIARLGATPQEETAVPFPYPEDICRDTAPCRLLICSDTARGDGSAVSLLIPKRARSLYYFLSPKGEILFGIVELSPNTN